MWPGPGWSTEDKVTVHPRNYSLDTNPEELEGIAIIGMSGRFPGAKNVEQFWENLVAGVDSISRFSDEQLEFSVLTPEAKARGAKNVAARGVIEDVDLFDAAFFGIYPREAELMDPQHRIFLECAWESLESAGYDPQAYEGLIGVFAGVSLNTYLLYNLCGNGGFAAQLAGNYQVGQYQAMLGNDKDFMPTRVSYKLNLRGPSMAIQTACSSSLVAISQACSSLLSYQCDMALSGGVSISFPQRRDYLYEEEGMASVDGTCRTFDADAKGTVFGHGSAVVLLKRLADAVIDRDNILAVIKGTAINNDGSAKIGYAAPSVNAQAEVIAMAQATADVSPASISYIEAHGTGTPLGDPIEIAALTKAFRDGGAMNNGFCAVGTGKPNISHLDVAAGATGLIKTVLQLQHGQIPPLLHFKSPNPQIDFANSPFFPVTKLLDWQRNGNPRRAGVSAFGVGGTNAHVVVEEAPLRTQRETSDIAQVFPLSAKTENALARMRQNLAARIDSDPDLNLADVAYTLQFGRKAFDYRSIVVASDRESLVTALNADSKKYIQAKAARSAPQVVFLFPGQGAQYVDMGRSLYEREAVFRNEVDRCAEILRRHLGQDVRSVLYPENAEQREAAEIQINETWMTQPVIFVVEYALAQLWLSWGIKPSAVIGHSIGEYVCAVLADSFALEDALALLSVRAKLMQSLPSGSMIGIRQSAAEIEPILPQDASIAAINSRKLCTVSGPTPTLEAFLVELETRKIASRMLATSHAFHSQMMDPILDEFTEVSRNTPRREPKIRWISTCTGKEMTAQQTSDASYWANQLRQTVRFSDALSTLVADSPESYILLEVGPGRTLNQCARQHAAKFPTGRIVASLEQLENGQDDSASTLTALGRLWTEGVHPDWTKLHGDQPRYRVPLPTYPFERKRFWIDPPANSADSPRVVPTANASPDSQVDVGETVHGSQHADAGVECSNSMPSGQATTESAAQATSTSPKQKIAQELRTILLNLSGMAIEDDHAAFIDLGFDSLFLTQASQAIDARFHVKITFRQLLGDLSTVAAIVRYLEPKLPKEMFAEVESPSLVMADDASTQSLGPAAAPLSNVPATDIERMLAGHLQSIQQLLDQSRRQRSAVSSATGSENSLRVVRKPNSGSAANSKSPEESKRFGPYKPLERGEQGGLTSQQEDALNRLIERYVKRTRSSKAYAAEHRPHFADPRAVSGFRSQWKEMVYPIVSARSKGAKIWDIDDNEYVDITMGFGTYFFGHSPDWLISAIEQQLRTGIEIGPQSPLAGKVAKMISEFTGLERVTFCNTGSEAVMAAMRLARTVTGRKRIVYFAGDYHGMFEEVLIRGAWPNGEYRAVPIAPGIPQSLAENILVLEYGAAESLEIIREHGDEIAAVMVEPVQSRNPSHQPRDFMHQLRALTTETGSALIFDEVVTGFRCHQGGAQAYFGVRADLATYGKVVGGGMPIGILAGSSRFMDALDGGQWQYGDDSFPEVGVTFFAGTFVRHPLAIAAAHAVLNFLKDSGPELQSRMSERVHRVCSTINEHMQRAQVPIRMSSFSAFAAIDYAQDLKYASLLWYYLRDKGIHIWEGRPCYFTLAHTDEDLERFINAFRESVSEMQQDGFLPQSDATHALSAAGSGLSLGETSASFPLAEGQREMWLGAQMSPDAAGPHHACNAFELQGELDLPALRNAMAQVVNRHEGLRCTFNSEGTQVLIQPGFTLDMPLTDLSSLAADEQQASVQKILATEGQRLFDLAEGPLIAAQLLKLADRKHLLVFTAQMIACDGWSHYVVFEELSEIYSAIRESRNPELRDVVPMRDYARWQQEYWQTAQAKECEDYWRGQFDTVPAPLDLPSIGPRPLARTVNADRVDVLLSPEFYDQIKGFGRAQKSSSFAVLLAAFQVWLHRLSGARDLVVGVPFSAQSTLGFDTLVGQCANTLPIRAQLQPEQSFDELLAKTWDKLLDAQEHTHYTFGRLIQHLDIRHDPSRIPLVSVIFNIDPAMSKVKFSGLKHRFFAAPRFYYQFDLGFNLVEEQDGLRVECDFNTNLFDRQIVQRWLFGYEALLRAIVQNRQLTLAELPMLKEETEAQIVGPSTEVAETVRILHLIEEQTRRTPTATAVSDEHTAINYGQLDSRANCLASRLQRILPAADAPVGILAERSTDMIVALLAVLKSGRPIVPLHPALPQGHLAHIAKDAGLAAVIAHDSLNGLLSGIDCPILALQTTSADAEGSPKSEAEGDSPYVARDGSRIAFVMYQPNSSGLPRGVELSHGSVVNFLRSMQREPGLTEADVVLNLSPLVGDGALLEIFLPLTVGAHCVVASQQDLDDSQALKAKLTTAGITLFQATPTILRRLLGTDWRGAPSLRILVGGETVRAELVNRLLTCCGELWHMFGRTETTSWSSVQRLSADKPVTLGNPTDNTRLCVVDDHLRPVPLGVPGELLVGGHALASGYRNLPELNARRFVVDLLPSPNCHRLFRSGCRVKRLACGELEFVGERDSRVMLHERDVELGEIEALLSTHADVNDAAVMLRDDLAGAPGLVAYVFCKQQISQSAESQKQMTRELRRLIRSKLPAHMLPARFVYPTAVPLTWDGKLDRTSLPAPSDDVGEAEDDFVAASTRTQEILTEIWQDVLKVPKVGIHDNFFDLGGQSLMAVKLFARIESDLGRKLPLATLFRSPTIAQLSAVFDNQLPGSEVWPSLVPIQPLGNRKPLFLVHGAGGNVLLYHALAKHLAPDYPLYGLQSQGLDGASPPLQTIEEMAEHYLKELRTVQSEGPYYLGGYCLGGTVAYEMAQRLTNAGEEVALVAMLDTYNFSRALKSSLIGFLLQKIRFHLGNVIGLRPRHMLEYFKEKFRVARDGEFANLFTSRPGFDVDAGRATSGVELKVQAINDTAAETYLPKPYQGTLTLFKPRINYKFYPDPKMGWGDLAGELKIVEFPFNPHAMLVEPYVLQLAEALMAGMQPGQDSEDELESMRESFELVRP